MDDEAKQGSPGCCTTRRDEKQRRLQLAPFLTNGLLLPADKLVESLELRIAPGIGSRSKAITRSKLTRSSEEKGSATADDQAMQSQHLFRGSIVNHHNTREDKPGLEVIGQFSTCGAKSYWIALVLTGDEKNASKIVASGIHEIADSGTVFGEWMCAWGIGVVIKACVALRADELRKEEGSGEYWRAKAAEGPTIELQQAPLSTERLRRTLLLLPLFPRFVFVLRVLEGYSLSYVASILNVDKDACQAALAYSFGVFLKP